MPTVYTETPHNYYKIESLLETNVEYIVSSIIVSRTLFFYDTCSFRTHSNLSIQGMSKLADFFEMHGGQIIITRCVLMELASISGIINDEYIKYLEYLFHRGIKIILLDEECLFEILMECFSSNVKANEYLTWAVRMSRSPVSAVTQTLKNDIKLSEEVLEGKNSNRSDIYRSFFSTVRSNKEHSDNLGEELIGVCVHILSHLPGTKDGKLWVVTDDKGAAGKIDALMKRTNAQFRGAKIILLSTPKLAQYMYQDGIVLAIDDMIEILSQGTSDKVVVMGTTAFDLTVDRNITMTNYELAQKIMEPNGINIVF